MTAAFCAAFVLAGLGVRTIHVYRLYDVNSFATFATEQVDVLGLLAIGLASATLVLGFAYRRSVAERLGFAPETTRAVHMTVALSTVGTIALHILASYPGFNVSVAQLVIPFLWTDRGGFPYPTASGVIAVWLIAVFGLSYFIRGRLGGHARWRLWHHAVIVAVALAVLHTILLAGWIPGWTIIG